MDSAQLVEFTLWMSSTNPPAGTVHRADDSVPRRFEGWLGLLEAMSALLAAENDPVATDALDPAGPDP